MAGMKHNVPGEFKNETIWMKYFTTKQLCFLGGAFLIIGLCYRASVFLVNSGFPGILTGLVMGAFIMAPVMLRVPDTEFLKGGGLYFSTLFVRRLVRWRNRKIYVKGWGKG